MRGKIINEDGAPPAYSNQLTICVENISANAKPAQIAISVVLNLTEDIQEILKARSLGQIGMIRQNMNRWNSDGFYIAVFSISPNVVSS